MQVGQIIHSIKSFLNTTWLRIIHFRLSKKQWLITLAVISLVFVASNIATAVYYQERYYPSTQVGDVFVGNLTASEATKILLEHSQRQSVMLAFNRDMVQITPNELGANYDIPQTINSLNQLPKPVLPIMGLFPSTDQKVEFIFDLDQDKFDKKVDQILDNKDSEPVNATLEIADGQARIVSHEAGRTYDTESVKTQIKEALGALASVPVVVEPQLTLPNTTEADLQSALQQAEQKMDLKIQLTYEEKNFQPSKSDIGTWLKVDEDRSIALNEDEIAAYVEKIAEEIDQPVTNNVVTTLDGVETDRKPGQAGRALNRQEAIKAITSALTENTSLDYELKTEVLEPADEFIRKYTYRALTYNYCVVANQVDNAMLGEFSNKISTTLADNRGWGLDGRIQFREVGSGCAFYLVLAAAHTLPSYSPVCSIYYSCRVGANVIINVDKWNNATDSWNSAGGSIQDYRSMVINHELGHWLGIADNQWVCAGPGQPAPLMQQQSIDLRGCTFNPWPLEQEKNYLKAIKGL